jgi:hypothetical protein
MLSGLAGILSATTKASIDFLTTALLPITAPGPTVTSGITTTCAASQTPPHDNILGHESSNFSLKSDAD